MSEIISVGSLSGEADLGTGSASITPSQARVLQERMLRMLGSRKCDHDGANVFWLENGAVRLECKKCDLRAVAHYTEAARLGWLQP